MSPDISHPDVNTSATVPPVAKRPMVMRSIRVPLALWERLKAKADEDEKDVSQVIRELIERYLGDRR